MVISWKGRLSVISTVLSDGSELIWTNSIWSRAGKAVTNGVFTVTNAYLASLPISRLQELELLYTEANDIISSEHRPAVLTTELRPIVTSIIGGIDWVEFCNFCIETGLLRLEAGVKESLDDKDKVEQTYFTEQYNELVYMSELLKLLMPIFGSFDMLSNKILGKDKINQATLDLYRDTYIPSLQPYVTLTAYVEFFTNSRVKNANFNLIRGIGENELHDYVFSLVVLKKVITFDSTNPELSIVRNVYNIAKQTCGTLSTNGPINRKIHDDTGDEIPVADRYRVYHSQPMLISVLAGHYTRDIHRYAKAIEPGIDLELVDQYKAMVADKVTLEPYIVSLVALVINKVAFAKSLMIMENREFETPLAVAAAVLDHRGFKGLAAILTVKPTERDMFKVSALPTKNFDSIDAEIVGKLSVMYPFTGVNPIGVPYIEHFSEAIHRNDWDIPRAVYSNIPNELGLLLIKRGAEK